MSPRSELHTDDWVLCTGTLRDGTLPEKIRAASAAGFRGLSVRPHEYVSARADGWSDADLIALLDDCNIAVAELDPIMTWLPGATPHATSAHSVDEFLHIADVLRPDCLSVLIEPDWRGDLHDAIEPFARLCDLAAVGGHTCALEFFSWSPLNTLAQTYELIAAADRPNAALIFDTWHHYRVGGTKADLRQVDGSRIVGVQLSDAPATPTITPVSVECMRDRRWPGEGDSGVLATVAALRATGCTAPLGIEVFGGGDPLTRANEAARAIRALLG